MPLLEYLYIDTPKVVSLHNQIAGATGTVPTASFEAAQSNHSLLMTLEAALGDQGYLLDLTQGDANRSLRDPVLRGNLAATCCVKVSGRAVFEDYRRIRQVADAFTQAAEFVNRTVESSVRNSDDFKQLEMTISAVADELKEDTDRNSRATSQERLKQMKSDLGEAINAATTVATIDQRALDGLKIWIDSFLTGIIKLRVYPSFEFPDEQVFGNLKQEHFIEQDSGAFNFSHGAHPSRPITMLGIVSSVPTEAPDTFSPLAEFDREVLLNAQSLEKSNRDILLGFADMELLASGCRFPRVLVQPLMVYRAFEPNRSAVRQKSDR
jgi:hypothetical protein